MKSFFRNVLMFLALLTASVGCVGEMSAQTNALPPVPQNYFNDYVGVVRPSTAQELNRQLDQFDRDTTNQIVVAIYSRLSTGASLADYARSVANSWGVGQKDRNNGVLLLVFMDDRKMQIEVGRGLESVLPDAVCQRIIDNDITPRFHHGDYDGGLRVGLAEILATIQAGTRR